MDCLRIMQSKREKRGKGMKKIAPEELVGMDYSVNVINSLRQVWRERTVFDCLHAPKKNEMLLYLDGCDAQYTMKDGSCFAARSGDVVYLPTGCAYRTQFLAVGSREPATVGINLRLLTEESELFCLSDSPIVLEQADCGHIVERIDCAGSAALPCPARMKSGVYELFTRLSERQRFALHRRFAPIAKGIARIERGEESVTIARVAQECNVSEAYFRRLFKEYAGVSPGQYRLRARLEKAKSYLAYSDVSIEQLAQMLNFADTSYFCRQFRLHTGMTPKKYRDAYLS